MWFYGFVSGESNEFNMPIADEVWYLWVFTFLYALILLTWFLTKLGYLEQPDTAVFLLGGILNGTPSTFKEFMFYVDVHYSNGLYSDE